MPQARFSLAILAVAPLYCLRSQKFLRLRRAEVVRLLVYVPGELRAATTRSLMEHVAIMLQRCARGRSAPPAAAPRVALPCRLWCSWILSARPPLGRPRVDHVNGAGARVARGGASAVAGARMCGPRRARRRAAPRAGSPLDSLTYGYTARFSTRWWLVGRRRRCGVPENQRKTRYVASKAQIFSGQQAQIRGAGARCRVSSTATSSGTIVLPRKKVRSN